MVRPATTKRAETKASKVEDRDNVILTDQDGPDFNQFEVLGNTVTYHMLLYVKYDMQHIICYISNALFKRIL